MWDQLMNRLKYVFWNSHERRLRALWRLVVQMILLIAALIVLAVVTHILGNGPGSAAVGSVLYLALGAGIAWLAARFVDRRPIADYGFHLSSGWWKD
jgi:hypothetical protein